VKLVTFLYLGARLRIRKAIPPPPIRLHGVVLSYAHGSVHFYTLSACKEGSTEQVGVAVTMYVYSRIRYVLRSNLGPYTAYPYKFFVVFLDHISLIPG
jgi:hypothetical protein